MRRNSILRLCPPAALVLALLAFASASRGQAPATPPPIGSGNGATGPAALSAEQWRSDLQYLVGVLPEKHIKPFAKVTKEEWLGAASALEARLPSMAPHIIAVEFARLVAMLGDAHTVAYAGGMPPGFRSYPIRLYWFAEGLCVAAATSEHRDLLGARLVRVGNAPIDDAVAKVATTFANENEALLKTGAAGVLTTPETLHALGLIADMEAARFAFEPAGAGEALREATLAPVADAKSAQWVRWPDAGGAPTPLARSNPQAHYWSALDETSGVFFIQYNRCQDAPDLSVADFVAQALEFVDAQKPRAVAVDLRYNSGGSSRLLMPLIRGLSEREAINAPDRLFVLIGRQTFSSALMNAVQFRQFTKATLIGEPTGGRPNHFGETKSFTLPHSGMVIQYSTKHFRQQDKDEDALSPDVHVAVRGEDYARGRDPVMDEVARRAGPAR